MIEFWSKNRGLLAVILGMLTAFMTVMLVEAIGHAMYPPPQKLDAAKPETIREYIDKAPLGAMLMVVLAQVLGALVAGYVSTKVAPVGRSRPFYITMSIYLIATVANYVSIPHPIWMPVTTLLVMGLAAYTGYQIARRSTERLRESEHSQDL